MLFKYLPSCCVLCRLETYETHQLCVPCFNSCRVYSDYLHDACFNTFALAPYRDPIMGMIKKLKFKQELIYAKTLGLLLAEKIQQDWYKQLPLPDRLIPVPLHANRLKERGFNQSVEIGRYLVRELGIPLDHRSITRIKPTLAQSGLSKTMRQQNMRNAFRSDHRFDGLHIAILDDVITTGETVAALRQLLIQQGAKRIDVWCCARA